MKRAFWAMLAAVLLLTAGCGQPAEEETMEPSFKQISQEEAKTMMAQDDGHLIVDVRRQDEYDAGHIPGAILLPNERIGGARPAELPDPDQILLLYCRSGNRSKQAAQKLAELGYTKVYEFGGIITWTGEIVTAEEEAAEAPQAEEPTEETGMQLIIGETEVPVVWEENETVEALRELLPLALELHMYGGFEQVGPIGSALPRDDRQITTEPGDIVLYSGSQLVIFYGSNAWAYTRLGHVTLSEAEMTELLGHGDVTVTLRAAAPDGD